MLSVGCELLDDAPVEVDEGTYPIMDDKARDSSTILTRIASAVDANLLNTWSWAAGRDAMRALTAEERQFAVCEACRGDAGAADAGAAAAVAVEVGPEEDDVNMRCTSSIASTAPEIAWYAEAESCAAHAWFSDVRPGDRGDRPNAGGADATGVEPTR